MTEAGVVFALDLARQAGYATGRPGAKPESGAMKLAPPKQGRDVVFGNLIALLNNQWRADRPAIVVCEAPLALDAVAKLGNSQDLVRMTYGLHAIVGGMCARYGIRHEEVNVGSARKHFLGRARLGDRESTKAAVVARCHLLGYMHPENHNDNQADALAVWDWACAHLMRTPPAELHMFGEEAHVEGRRARDSSRIRF